MRSIIATITSTGVVTAAAALTHLLWPIVLSATCLVLLALTVITAAAFSKRNAPMNRIRALIRDLRGDRGT